MDTAYNYDQPQSLIMYNPVEMEHFYREKNNVIASTLGPNAPSVSGVSSRIRLSALGRVFRNALLGAGLGAAAGGTFAGMTGERPGSGAVAGAVGGSALGLLISAIQGISGGVRGSVDNYTVDDVARRMRQVANGERMSLGELARLSAHMDRVYKDN